MPELGDFENLQVLVNNPKVCLNALSTSLIGIFPITRSTATSERVARFSVITTESLNKPESLPADESKLINTRLGWLARNTRLVIIAAMRQPSSSARAYYRILKLVRTIGDFVGYEEIRSVHLAAALQYLPKLMMG